MATPTSGPPLKKKQLKKNKRNSCFKLVKYMYKSRRSVDFCNVTVFFVSSLWDHLFHLSWVIDPMNIIIRKGGQESINRFNTMSEGEGIWIKRGFLLIPYLKCCSLWNVKDNKNDNIYTDKLFTKKNAHNEGICTAKQKTSL